MKRQTSRATTTHRKAQPHHASDQSHWPLSIAALFLAFITILTLTAKLPLAGFGLYIGASLIAFVAYALDKAAACSGKWRTQESTLHLLALVGGWPGALVAQNRLRHKSRKISFQVVFWATVLLNCGALGWLLTAGSSAWRGGQGLA